MQYSPNQIYGAPNNPGSSNPNANNINSGQYSGRAMPNHVRFYTLCFLLVANKYFFFILVFWVSNSAMEYIKW